MIVRIVNIVAACKIQKIKVRDMMDLVTCQYVPSRFAAAIISIETDCSNQIKSKKINVNVYTSAITSTGSEKPSDAIEAIMGVVAKINAQKKCIEFITKPIVSNMTVIAYPENDSERINPDTLKGFEKVPYFSQVKGTEKGCTVMVSKSGVLTITGAKSLESAIGAMKSIQT